MMVTTVSGGLQWEVIETGATHHDGHHCQWEPPVGGNSGAGATHHDGHHCQWGPPVGSNREQVLLTMMVTTVSGGLQWEVIVEQVLLTMMVTTVSGGLQWEVIESRCYSP